MLPVQADPSEPLLVFQAIIRGYVHPRAPRRGGVRAVWSAAHHHVRIEAHKLPLEFLDYDRAHLQSLTQFAYGPGDGTRVREADLLEGYQHPHRRSTLAGRGRVHIGGHEASYRRR